MNFHSHEVEMMANALPSDKRDEQPSNLFYLLIARSTALREIAHILHLSDNTDHRAVVKALKNIAEVCGRSTAELDINQFAEIAILKAKLSETEAQLRHWQDETKKLRKESALRSATKSVSRFKPELK